MSHDFDAIYRQGHLVPLERLKLREQERVRVHIEQMEKGDIVPIDSILMGYADQKFDLADAALMHLTNREGIETVFTLDQRHFSVYRNQERRPLHILPPT